MTDPHPGHHRFDLLGTNVAIWSPVPVVREAVVRFLRPVMVEPAGEPAVEFWLEASPQGRPSLRGPGYPAREEESWAAVLAVLVAELNKLALERCMDFAAHCGVVAANGEAIAFPGISGQGKTTLVAACVAAGLDYVSDEALCVAYSTGTIRPYLKPLALSHRSRQLLGIDHLRFPYQAGETAEALLTAEDLGGRTVQRPPRLAHVVHFVRGAERASLQESRRSLTVTALLQHSFNHYRQPSAAFALVHRLASESRTWELSYGDAREGAALIAQLSAQST